MSNFLSSAAIAANTQAGDRVAIEVVGQTGSTNADLLARVSQLSQPTLLAAESQTAGRGRAGRTWLSTTDSLTFSLAWPLQRTLRELAGLSLAVGVALAEALATRNVPVRLKWPNDLWLDDAKLGGVLIETALDRSGAAQVWVIVGIGINLAQPDELTRQIGKPVAALPAQLAQDRNQLLGQLLDSLADGMRQFERDGFAAFQDRWSALHAWTGKSVAILERDAIILEGIAAGVDAQGQLLLQTPTGEVPVLVGDVSLRRVGNKGEQHAAAG
jgi:BirA family biotin operon repressor/biotin-[acetyl-CoA-carboxylase] ligase